jgi:signal transduction histidine kinase
MMADRTAMWPSWAARITAAFALVIAGLTPFTHHEGPTSVLEVVLLGAAVLPWVLEAAGKRLPRPVFAAWVLLPLGVLNVAGNRFGLLMEHDAQLSLMLVVLAVGQLAATTPARDALGYAMLALLVPLGRFGLEPGFEEWVFWAAGIFLAGGSGMILRRQEVLLEQLRAAQDALADEAALQERRRIAREVHDVIAHSLTVSLLHLTAARLAVRRDAREAEEALAEAEKLGRQALNDVRRTVGLLHDRSGDPTAAALPTASDIPALIEAYTTAGLEVHLDCSADLTLLTPAGGLALYRAVQEGLSNVVKHAPGAVVTVAISLDAGQLVIEIHNDIADVPASASTSGLGLRGMRERVEALGGSFAAGPRGDGWVTSCAIPVQSAP